MTDFLRLFLTMSAMGALAIPITLLLKTLCGKWLSPKAQLYMWLPVLLRLFVPYIPESPLSVYNLLPEDAVYGIVLPKIPWVYAPVEIRLLPLIWILGAVCFVMFSLISYLRFVKRLEFSSPKKEQAEKIAKDAAILVGLKKQPETVFCKNPISPMVVGLLSPKLVLPEHILSRFDEAQLRIIFVHEYTHLKRRDGLLNWLLLLIGCLHWFNPLVYLMRSCIRRDSEQVCDACVLQTLSRDARLLYSKTILDLLETTVSVGSSVTTAPMAGSKRTVKGRLRSIYRIGKQKLSILALPFCLMLSVTLLTGALAADVSQTVGTVSELLDPVIVLPPAQEPQTTPIPAPSPTAQTTPEPTSFASATPPAPLPAPTSTPMPSAAPTPAPTPTPAASAVYIYQGNGAVARFSKDRNQAGFSANFDNTTISVIGIRRAADDSFSGFFTIAQNGETVAENIPGTVRGSTSAITFSSADGAYRYSFPLISRTVE